MKLAAIAACKWRWALGLTSITAALLLPCVARAEYPEKPIRVIVPYAAGGGTDIFARRIGPELSKRLGQPIVIDNKPGGGTSIGAGLVARAAPDGYTVLLNGSNHGVLQAIFPDLSFDPVKDFEPVTLIATTPNVLLINPSIPAKTMSEFLAYAKSRSDPLNYGSSGFGSTGHLAMEFLKRQTGINFVHVPYVSGAPAMAALVGGQVDVLVNNISAAMPQIAAGKVRPLGMTSKKRAKAVPNIPSIAEAASLPTFDMTSWFGIFLPARTPNAIVMKLNSAVNEVMRMPEIQEAFAKDGAETVGTTPEELEQVVRADVQRWGRTLKQANIKAE